MASCIVQYYIDWKIGIDQKIGRAKTMSTRSNTVIKDLKTGEEAVLYNHYDGYLSGAGFD